MVSPVINNDPVGIPSIGTQSSHTNAYGEKWQFAIAVDLLNRKFDFGSQINLSVTADPFGSSVVNANAAQIGVSAAYKNINSYPSNYIQFGDKAVLGPSTVVDYEGETEVIRISTAAQDNPTNTNNWENGVIYSLDRRNQHKYQSGDPVTVLGTGLAAGWFARNAHLATLGIMKGYSSLGAAGRYSTNKANTNVGDIGVWENSLGTEFIGLSIQLPAHPGYSAAFADGEVSVFNSKRGLAPWRDPSISSTPVHDGTWDWAGDSGVGSAIDFWGVFRYTREFNNDNFAYLAYNANADAQAVDWPIKNTWAPVLTGFVHGGGQFKDTAQCLFVMANSQADTNSANRRSIGIFSQLLVRSLNDSRDASQAKLVPGTNYRLGLTWKGNLLPDEATNTIGSQVFAKFQWGPVAYHGGANTNHYLNSILSTSVLLDETTRSQNGYKTNMVSGFVKAIDVDDLDTWDNLRIEIIIQAEAEFDNYYSPRRNRGTEILMFIDNIFLEHEGDITGASGEGYVEIDHYPESGTLQVRRFKAVKPARVLLSSGRFQSIDPTGSYRRQLYEISADFERVSQTVWTQIEELLRWQDLGYNLALHPSMPGIPHCLIGQLEISNEDRSHWDITRKSFRLKFTEAD